MLESLTCDVEVTIFKSMSDRVYTIIWPRLNLSSCKFCPKSRSFQSHKIDESLGRYSPSMAFGLSIELNINLSQKVNKMKCTTHQPSPINSLSFLIIIAWFVASSYDNKKILATCYEQPKKNKKKRIANFVNYYLLSKIYLHLSTSLCMYNYECLYRYTNHVSYYMMCG